MPKSDPKPQSVARGLIIQNNKLLFVSDNKSKWILPGGRQEFGETLQQCVEREVYEETGFEVVTGELYKVFDFIHKVKPVHKIEHVFYTKIIQGKLDDNWQDNGGLVRYRKFVSLEEIKANNNFFPRLLLEYPLGHLTNRRNY